MTQQGSVFSRLCASVTRKRMLRFALPGLIALVFLGMPAMAQAAGGGGLSIDFSGGGMFTEHMLQIIALITILSLAPAILIMMTSFVRIVVVLSILRTALGTSTTPPNTVLISLALFLTLFIMTPTFNAAYDAGVKPLIAGDITTQEAFSRAEVPMKTFMLGHTRKSDLKLFVDIAKQQDVAKPTDLNLTTVAPAFMISELRRAFEIGFLLFVPFLIIDMSVASILMSMGMMMLPPVTISLPFKLIFFVLVDGWHLIAGSLIESYMNGPPPG